MGNWTDRIRGSRKLIALGAALIALQIALIIDHVLGLGYAPEIAKGIAIITAAFFAANGAEHIGDGIKGRVTQPSAPSAPSSTIANTVVEVKP